MSASPPLEELQRRMTDLLSKELGNKEAGMEATFFEQGLDSLGALDFASNIENALQIPLTVMPLLMEAPSVASLSHLICEELDEEELEQLSKFLQSTPTAG